jgi:exodeoxyribonuclease V alpha subunit
VTGLPQADLDVLSPVEREEVVSRGVVRLRQVHRFSSHIQTLAEAVRSGDADRLLAVLGQRLAPVEFVETDLETVGAELDGLRADVVAAGTAVVSAARDGDAAGALAALDRHRLLCAHRDGPFGVERWAALVEEWLGQVVDGYGRDGLWYVGRPLLVAANDHQLRLYNGDTGVVVQAEGRAQAAFRRQGGVSLLAPSRLSDVSTMHALSVHRSQGSQFDTVTVLLPPADSPLLTRELLYTAVTRAKHHVRIVGSVEALTLAVRRPVVRASGLRRR